ncbi:MAG: apolipoprotein N-acyltransferase [Pyrinomonadaceae bacterium]
MKLPRLRTYLPSAKSIIVALIAAVMLILAFPDFEIWPLAWFALVPLLTAVDREKESFARSFVCGWIFGTVFFFGTCWWLAFAPITYAGFPPPLAYSLLFCVTVGVGLFPALFAGLLSILLRRLGSVAVLSAPFIWVFTEFLRYWITGNNWNAIGYSQAFSPSLRNLASVGGIALVSFVCAAIGCLVALAANRFDIRRTAGAAVFIASTFVFSNFLLNPPQPSPYDSIKRESGTVVAVQPNVPMVGLSMGKWRDLRLRHVGLAEAALARVNELSGMSGYPKDAFFPTTVIFPESPMNFSYADDAEFRHFVTIFAAKNNVDVLFNSAEPDLPNKNYFNSAVLVDTRGNEIAQYDKIYLLPFGESVPEPLQSIVPAFVGSFSYGKKYDLIPLGAAKAGVMICFESHFGELSRRYVRDGADVLIEMTNDGYLGPTPVLRQHLANAVFRAVETNRPVLRVTNVGITAYINERGEVIDPTDSYTEATRVWSISKSDGSQTFYVKYGDWFAWLCTLVTLILAGLSLRRRSVPAEVVH